MNIPRITVLVLTAAFSLAVQASDFEEVPQQQVSYAGLDLKTEAGAQILYRRIRAAALSVCNGLYTREFGERRRLWQKCVDGAIARAVTDVDVPTLTAYYAAKTRKVEKPVALAAEH